MDYLPINTSSTVFCYFILSELSAQQDSTLKLIILFKKYFKRIILESGQITALTKQLRKVFHHYPDLLEVKNSVLTMRK